MVPIDYNWEYMWMIPFATSSWVQAAAIFLAEKGTVKSLIATKWQQRTRSKGASDG